MKKIKLLIGVVAGAAILSGCSSVGSSAMNAGVGGAIDMVGTLLDKPLEISDSMKGKVTFETHAALVAWVLLVRLALALVLRYS